MYFSYALICRQATGEKVVLYNGAYVTETRAKYLAWRKKTKFNIMELPTELRELVLDEVIEPSVIKVFLPCRYGQTPTAISLPSIAYAGDRKLRLEALLVTIKRTTFEIHSGPGNEKFQEWLASLNFRSIREDAAMANGYGAVHSLSFPYFSFFPHATLGAAAPNNDIMLMQKCTYLRKVTIHWRTGPLFEGQTGNIKTVQQLRRSSASMGC